jgi:hypothetical protein
MGWFSFLTGQSSTAEKVVDGAINGLDAMFFTAEEKSVASQKILDWKLKYASASQGMSISRRVITFTISGAWLLLVLLTVAVGLLQGGDHPSVTFLMKIMIDVVMQPFSIIVGFYFLAHVVGSARK